MANYLIRRFFQMFVVVLLSTVAIYILLNVAPGGPISPCLASPRNCPSEAEIARLEAYLGLHRRISNAFFTIVHIAPTGAGEAKSGLLAELEISRREPIKEWQHNQPCWPPRSHRQQHKCQDDTNCQRRKSAV